MMYGSWDMKCNRQNFVVILGHFLPFYPTAPPPQQPEKWKYHKWKKSQEISSFYTSVPKILIIGYAVPEIWRMTGVIVIFILGYTFPFYSPCPSPSLSRPKNENFKKMKANPTDIILHKCTKNHDHMLYCSWDMACDGWNYFSF